MSTSTGRVGPAPEPPTCSGGEEPTTITIRPVNGGDIEALCEIYYDFHEFHVRGVPSHLRSLHDRERWDRSSLTEALAQLVNGDKSRIFVAQGAGGLAGLVEVYVRRDGDEATVVQHWYAELMVEPPPLSSSPLAQWAQFPGVKEPVLVAQPEDAGILSGPVWE